MKTPDADIGHEGGDIFRYCFDGLEDDPEPDASFIFNEAQRLLKRALVLRREASFKSRTELSQCEAELKKLTKGRDDLKLLYV